MTDQGHPSARYALPAAAVAFAAGIFHGRYGPLPSSPEAWIQLSSATLLLLLLCVRFRRHLTEATAALLLFFLAGILHVGPPPGAGHVSALDHLLDTGDPVVLSGRMATAPSFDGERTKLLLQVDQHWQPDGTIIASREQVLLTMPFPCPAPLSPGDRLLVRATLRRPQPPGTPGSFDYRQYLADRDIHVTGHLRSPACLAELHLSPAGDDWRTTLPYQPQQARQQVNAFIAAAPLPPAIVGLYQALVTGEAGLVPERVLADFRASGAFHLLSISGTHLGLLGLLGGLVIGLLLRRSRWLLLNLSLPRLTAGLTILILLAYSLLAGMTPPVARSLLMALCLIGSLLINRPHSLPNGLGLALLLSLLWHPTDLFHASFQLTYAAVIGIVLLHEAGGAGLFRSGGDEGATARFRRWLLASLAVSLAALLATAPITQHHFRQVAFLGPLSTLLLAPLLCFWSLPLGLVASLLSPLFPDLATSLLELGSLGLAGAVWLNGWLAGLAVNGFQPPAIPLGAIPLYYLGIVTLLLGRNSLPARVVAASSLAAMLLMTIFSAAPAGTPEESRVTFLDVGQGSATLLELPGNRNILVDGGSSGAEGYDAGAAVIAPFLRHQGIDRLEGLVITHDHGDHHNGLATVIEQFRPATVWCGEGAKRSAELEALLSMAAARGAAIRVPAPGEEIVAGPNDRLTCISRHHLASYAGLPENRRSLVLRLDSRGRTFLLPGDIMAADGESLLAEGESLRCDVLLAPHHGSDNSASLNLARAGGPELLVVSAGGRDSGRFPGRKVREWCEENGIDIHRTGDLGALACNVTPGGLSWRRLSGKGGDTDSIETE